MGFIAVDSEKKVCSMIHSKRLSNPGSVLITGITGFVGSHMADLISSRYPQTKFRACKRWHHSDLTNIRHLLDKITFIDCDLTDPLSTADLVKISKPEVIFHFAAESFVSPSWKNPTRYKNLNYHGTVNLLEAVRQYSPDTFIHIPGSGEEYGDIKKEDLPITESTNINPVNPYAVTKVAQDLIAKVYFVATEQMSSEQEVLIMKDHVEKMFLVYHGTHIKYVELKGLQPPTLKTGHTGDKRNFTHVLDMCNAYLLAVQHCIPGDLYLVGNSDLRMSVHRRSSQINDKNIRVENIEVEQDKQYIRPTNVPYLISDSSKFISQTNWTPLHTLQNIFTDTIEYWPEHPSLAKPVQSAGTIYPF